MPSQFQRSHLKYFQSRQLAIVVVAFLLMGTSNLLVSSASSTAKTSVSLSTTNQKTSNQINHGMNEISSSSGSLSVAPTTSQSSSSGGPLNYNVGAGGPVMHIPTAYAIFWLPPDYHFESGFFGSDSNYESLIKRFLQDIGGSSYLSIVTEYPDNTAGSPPGILSFGGSYLDTTPYPSGINLSDFYFPNEIMHAANVNGWTEGTNSIFFIFTALNVMPQLLEANTCAYHNHFTDSNTGKNVVWANIPDLSVIVNNITCQVWPSPNYDQFADSAVNMMSHELFESLTDPLVTAWASSAGGEIADLCDTNFGSQVGSILLNPGADVELNGNYYRVQEEWSNAANACTLTGPSTFTDPITLNYYGGQIQSGDYFPVTYIIGGQTFIFHDTGGIILIVTDPFSSVTIGGMSSLSSYHGGELWCFDLACQSYTFTSTANRVALEYYDLLAEYATYSVSDGSVVPVYPVPLSTTFLTAPSQMGVSGPSETTSTLSTLPQTIWVINGATLSFTPEISSSSTERWAIAESNYTASSPYKWNSVEYYHQYAVNFNAGITGGGTGYTLPSISYISTGSSQMVNYSSHVWADAGSLYYYPQTLGGSSSLERWITQDPLSNEIGSSETISLDYLHQYFLTLSISPSNSGSLSSASGWYNDSQSLSLSASSNSGWLFDGWTGMGSGSYSGANNPASLVVNGPISEQAIFASQTSSNSSSSTNVSSSTSSGTQTNTTSLPQAPPPGSAASTTTGVGNSGFAFSLIEEQVAFITVAAIIGVILIVASILFFRRRKDTTGFDN